MKYIIQRNKLQSIIKTLDDISSYISNMDGEPIVYEYNYNEPYRFTYNDERFVINIPNIDIKNPVLTINDVNIIGIIEHSRTKKDIIYTVYDDHIPEQQNVCGNCNSVKYRKYSYVLRNINTNQVITLCSSCMKKTLNFDVSMLIKHAHLISELNNVDIEKLSKKAEKIEPLDFFLKKTIAYLMKYKYVSTAQARNNLMEHKLVDTVPTSSIIWEMDNKYWSEIIDLLESNEVNETYTKIIEWSLNKSNNDYSKSVKNLINTGYVTVKDINLAVSIVNSFYNKTQLNENSKWIGEIGQRRIFENILLKKHVTFDSYFGISHCYTFETQEKDILIWFTSTVSNLKVDHYYSGKCTITKHSEYDGVKQTYIKRCSLKLI